jgi:hypothetical protein
MPDISRHLLTSMAEGRKLGRVTVSIGEGGAFEYAFADAPHAVRVQAGQAT